MRPDALLFHTSCLSSPNHIGWDCIESTIEALCTISTVFDSTVLYEGKLRDVKNRYGML